MLNTWRTERDTHRLLRAKYFFLAHNTQILAHTFRYYLPQYMLVHLHKRFVVLPPAHSHEFLRLQTHGIVFPEL